MKPVNGCCVIRDGQLAPAVHASFSNGGGSRREDIWPRAAVETAGSLCEWKDMDNRMAAVLKETGERIGSPGYRVDEADGEVGFPAEIPS